MVELSRTTPAIADVLTSAYTVTRQHLADLVSQAYPATTPEACATAAYGVLTCARGSVFLGEFDRDPMRLEHSRAAADAMLAAL